MNDNKAQLNKEQRRAVETLRGPLLILAGAGTGKTKTMVCRTAHMIQKGIAPEQILMITFTNKAAQEIKTRIGKMLSPDKANRITSCTFHSFCVAALKRYGARIGLPRFKILDNVDNIDVIGIAREMTEIPKTFRNEDFPSNTKIASLISASVNRRAPLLEIIHEAKLDCFAEKIIEIRVHAEEYKRKNAMLNFDDLLLQMIRLLQNNPPIARSLATRYPYIIVDEYQDTNPLQEDILLYLFPFTKNIAVVGDDMQSLYAFRGADVENILRFPEHFPGCRTIVLNKNYRSSQDILDLSNRVCKHAGRGIVKNLIGTHRTGTLPVLYTMPTQKDEAGIVFNLMMKKMRNGASFGDFCVLARNAALTSHLEMILNRERVPYVKYGGPKFFELDHVRTILAYLKILSDPGDAISWFRVLQIHRGIGTKYAKKIADVCQEQGIEGLLDVQFLKQRYYGQVRLLYEFLESVAPLPMNEMVPRLIRFYVAVKKDAIEKSRRKEEKKRALLNDLRRREEDLRVLAEITADYQDIGVFLEDTAMDSIELNEEPKDKGQVTLSTIHSVKGLEYHTVFVLDCIEEIFPKVLEEEWGTKKDDEELRCFYVALTRAKEELYLMAPRFAMRYHRSILGRPAHYLSDAKDLIERRDVPEFAEVEAAWTGMLKRRTRMDRSGERQAIA